MGTVTRSRKPSPASGRGDRRGLVPPGATSTVTPAGIAEHDPDVIRDDATPGLTPPGSPEAPRLAVKMVRIDQITYDGRQKPDRELVKQLAEALRRGEVLPPIQVTREAKVLIQGRHRMEAYKLIGYAEIPAVLRDLDGDEDRRRASTLEENLRRRRLSALEVVENLAELKRLHKRLQPGSGRGGDRRSKAHRAPLIDAGKVETGTSFADRMSRVTGKSKSTINRMVAIGETLPQEVRDVVRGTALDDRPEEVAALAREARRDKENAVAAAKTVLAGEAKSVREALAFPAGPGEERPIRKKRTKVEPPQVVPHTFAGTKLRELIDIAVMRWRNECGQDASDHLAAVILEAAAAELRETMGDCDIARRTPR